METSNWYGSSDFVYSGNNAPPVLDIAMDMVGNIQPWSSADMDLLAEVNDRFFDKTKHDNEIQEKKAENTCASTSEKDAGSFNIQSSTACKDDTNIEFSNTGEESVFIARQDLVNSDNGLCVKDLPDTANTSSNAPSQNANPEENNAYVTAQNHSQYGLNMQQPYINYTANCHYGHLPVQPNVQYNLQTDTHQHNVDINYMQPNMGNPYPFPMYSTQPQYNNMCFVNPTIVSENDPIHMGYNSRDITGIDTIDNTGGNKQFTSEHSVKVSQQELIEPIIETNTGNRTHITKQCLEEYVQVDNKSDRKDESKPAKLGNDTRNMSQPQCSVIKDAVSISTTHVWKQFDEKEQNTVSKIEYPQPHELESLNKKRPTSTSKPRLNNVGSVMNPISNHPVPFNPRVPPPPLIHPVGKEAPKKMLLFNQAKTRSTYKPVAEATTPSGFKFYIPLDESRYALKKSKHDLYDIPERCSFHIFEKEGDFESSVFIDTSPRPIQIKGSLSDNDDTGSESGESDISQLTLLSTKPSQSQESVLTQRDYVNVQTESERREHNVGMANTNTAVGLTDSVSVEDTDNDIMGVNELSNRNTSNENDKVIGDKTHGDKECNTVEMETSNGEHTGEDISSYTIPPCPVEMRLTEREEATQLKNNDGEVACECIDSVNDVSIEVIVNADQLSDNAFQSQPLQTNVTQSLANSGLSAEASAFVPQVMNLMMPPQQPGLPFDTHSPYQQQWMPVQVEYVDPEQLMQLQFYDQVQPVCCQQYPVYATDNQQPAATQLVQPATYLMESNEVEINTTGLTLPEINQLENAISQMEDTDASEMQDDNQTTIPQSLIDPTDGLPYPALHISDDGLLTVILRHGVYVEMTTDKAIRIVNHEKKMVVSFNETGSKVCIIHPAAKIYQSETSVDAALSLGRKAKMTSQNIIFGNALKTYKFDYTVINEMPEFNNFRSMDEDLSVTFLDTNTGFFNSDVLLRCSELITRAYFEKDGDSGCKVIINGSKISQNDQGDVVVYSGSIRNMRMSPSTGVIRLRTQFVEIDIERNWNLKLTRGTHTLNSSHLGFILSNGKIKASIDQKNQMDAFTLPYYKRLSLGQPAVHSRPGGPRRRHMNYNTRYEPEYDHRGYARY